MYALRQKPNVSQCAVFSGRGSLFIVSQTQSTDDGQDEVMRPLEAAEDNVMVVSDLEPELGAVNIDTRGQVQPRQ